MQVMFVLGLEFALSKSDATAQQEVTRIGLQDDVTFSRVGCSDEPLTKQHRQLFS